MPYNAALKSIFGIILFTVFSCHGQRPTDLVKCVSSGEPHFVQWHPTTGPSSGITCMGNNMFKLVHNEYVEFDIKIISGYGVDVTITFLNGQDIPICTVRTKNFQMFASPHCGQYNVPTTLVNTTGRGQILTAKHPAANFLAIVTHTDTSPRQYTIEMWQPYALVPRSRGQCSVRNCNPTRTLPDAIEQPKPKQVISVNTARTICQIYLNNYQANLRYAPSQRSSYYNGTIQRLFDDCLFDVQVTGDAAAAAKSFEPLMIDDLVEGATDIDTIERMFIGTSVRAAQNFYTSSVGALVQVYSLFPRLQSNYDDALDQVNIG